MNDLRGILALPEVIVQCLMDGEVKKAVNHTVIFFNTFTSEAGRELFLLLADIRVHPWIKSVMKFIGVWDGECDEDFYNKLVKELA